MIKTLILVLTTILFILISSKNPYKGFVFYLSCLVFGALTGFQRVLFFEAYIVPIVLFLLFVGNRKAQYNHAAMLLCLYVFIVSILNTQSPFPLDNPIFFGVGLMIILPNINCTDERRFKIVICLWVYVLAKMLWYIISAPDPFAMAASASDRMLVVDRGLTASQQFSDKGIDPNYFGFIMGAGAILSMLFVIFYDDFKERCNIKKSIYKYLLLFLSLVLFFFSLKGLSRGIFLAEFFSIIVMLLFAERNRVSVVIISAVIIYVIMSIGLYDMIYERFIDESSASRMSLASDVFNSAYSDHGILGLLFGGGTNYPWNKFSADLHHRMFDVYSPHNSWIRIIIDYGILGFGLFASILYRAVKRKLQTVKNSNVSKILIVVFVYWSIAAFSIEPLMSYFGWVLLIVIL